MINSKKLVKVLTIAAIALGVITVALGLVLNFTTLDIPSAEQGGIIPEYAHFAKYILYSFLGISSVKYPTDFFANASFISGLLMCMMAVVWIVFACMQKEYKKILYGVGSILVGFIVSFSYFLLVSGIVYNHLWDFPTELVGGSKAMMVLIIVFANLLALIMIAMFVLYTIQFVKDRKAAKKECECEECSCSDEECECEECSNEIVEENKEEPILEEKIEDKKDNEESLKEQTDDAIESEEESGASENGEKAPAKRNYKAYHVSKHPTLDKWQVKGTGSDKALKLFDTQEQAIQYAKQVAKNQGVSIRVHSKKGRIRSI